MKVNGSLANISWSVPKPSNGPIKLYLIQVRAEDSDAKTMWWRNQTVDGQHTMTNLSVECAKSAYAVFVNVAAVTSDNITEYSGPPSDELEKEMCSNSGKIFHLHNYVGFFHLDVIMGTRFNVKR